ncbi:hypothetical protein R5R35_014548 [Gryllus longicercus]|uniref:Nudix hydrolase domain-containing protein n=1 Tax=Gryllus longicercus TaxID=2509291 RepID=A0AAN9Z068_9ORTH
MSKLWREAASIIIAGRTNVFKCSKITDSKINGKFSPDYKILVLKRGKSSRFFPGGYVFPGGATANEDSCQEWLNIYESLGFKPELLKILTSNSPTVPLFSDNSKPLHKSISLRITAIRETFEESGILLCRSQKDSTPSNWAAYMSGHQLQEWQKIVQNNAYEFLNLCKEFKCFPDIWSLHLWSNWLTPTNNPIRFDTAFFLATIDQLPPSFMNDLEMDDMKWCHPQELLQGNIQDSVWLPPPQYYEMSRIVTYQNIDQLNNFAVERSKHGCERWMPVQKKAKDGIICFLPGDEQYPQKIDCNIKDKMGELEGTMKNLRSSSRNIHRMELYENQGTKIFISNVEPISGHTLPNTNSKL